VKVSDDDANTLDMALVVSVVKLYEMVKEFTFKKFLGRMHISRNQLMKILVKKVN
jgi:hypothetical protein